MSATRWTRKEAVRLWRTITYNDLTQEQAGRRFGISRQRVNQVLKEHNLNRRASG